MTMGRRLPMRHSGYNWRQVPRPATSKPFWMIIADCSGLIFAAAVTRKIGARFATNIAITCCRPKGMPFQKEILPSSSVSGLDVAAFAVLIDATSAVVSGVFSFVTVSCTVLSCTVLPCVALS